MTMTWLGRAARHGAVPALAAAILCVLVPAVHAQTNLDVSGQLTVEGSTFTKGGLTNTGAINTGTLSATGGVNVGGNLDVTGTTKTRGIDNNGFAINTDTLTTTGGVNVGGVLSVNTAQTTSINNSGNINTETLNTTFGVDVGGNLEVTGSATLSGGASISGGLNNNNGGITNAGAITGATDITASGSITAGTGNFTTLNTTTLNFTSLGDITASGTVEGNTLTDGVASISGGNIGGVGTITANTGNIDTVNATNVNATNGSFTTVSVTGQSNLNGGASIANHLTVAPATTVDMGGNRVENVADPTSDFDAANKRYVDAKLASAFKEIDKNSQGIAIAMAMGGIALPDSKNFVLGANLGFFDDKQAIAVQGALRINPYLSLNGAIGTGLEDSSTLGGRVGFQVAW